MTELFEIAGQEFYFDLNEIAEFVRINDKDDNSLADLLNKNYGEDLENNNEELKEDILQGQLIDMTRWDLTKAMVETILTENGIVDEAMGITKLGEQLSIPFRLSFNTLVRHKLIKNK